jgi:hypothetical protein
MASPRVEGLIDYVGMERTHSFVVTEEHDVSQGRGKEETGKPVLVRFSC